ncbi:hypothetical protein EK599_07860 [Vibrio sp. T187]|uniref:hypothetical protein n=1 Tax=Vibrio TaxID=662 RepID=UPI0010CA0562|nr:MULTISPECIES: hypothetical protein [Vibrio]MBW3695608.1 hypothetical protein [Vibrio sp. T187]
MNRDDFSASTKRTLAERVGYRCSNPGCGVETAGASIGNNLKVTRIGVAAHITAAARGGPRYDESLSQDARKSITNGIWLCQSCSVLIDRDEHNYSVSLLQSWKQEAELRANSRIGKQDVNAANVILVQQTEALRVQKFIQFIYDFFKEPEYRLGELSTDMYYVNPRVYTNINSINDYQQEYSQNLRSYDVGAQIKQDEIVQLIYGLKDFLNKYLYQPLAHDYKLCGNEQYGHYSQEQVTDVENQRDSLYRIANLVQELNQFCERR